MALSAPNLRDAIVAALTARYGLTAAQQADATAAWGDVATEAIAEMHNADVATTVAVTSVSGVTAGAGVSGPGTGTGTGSIT